MTSGNTLQHDASDGKAPLEFPSPELIEFIVVLGILMGRDLKEFSHDEKTQPGLAAIEGGPVDFLQVIKCLLSDKANAWERSFLRSIGLRWWLSARQQAVFDEICRKCGVN